MIRGVTAIITRAPPPPSFGPLDKNVYKLRNYLRADERTRVMAAGGGNLNPNEQRDFTAWPCMRR